MAKYIIDGIPVPLSLPEQGRHETGGEEEEDEDKEDQANPGHALATTLKKQCPDRSMEV